MQINRQGLRSAPNALRSILYAQPSLRSVNPRKPSALRSVHSNNRELVRKSRGFFVSRKKGEPTARRTDGIPCFRLRYHGIDSVCLLKTNRRNSTHALIIGDRGLRRLRRTARGLFQFPGASSMPNAPSQTGAAHQVGSPVHMMAMPKTLSREQASKLHPSTLPPGLQAKLAGKRFTPPRFHKAGGPATGFVMDDAGYIWVLHNHKVVSYITTAPVPRAALSTIRVAS